MFVGRPLNGKWPLSHVIGLLLVAVVDDAVVAVVVVVEEDDVEDS